MTPCATIQEWLSAHLDGEATPEEEAAVEDHLKACGLCQREADRLEAVCALVAQGLEAAPAPQPAPWFAAHVAARLRPARRWSVAWPALAAAAAGVIMAWFLISRPTRHELLSVYDLKPVEPRATAAAHRPEPPSVEHYLEVHAREASSASPVDSQGLVEYVGFLR